VDVAEGVLVALQGGSPHYAVNAPYVAPEEQGIVAPYVALARKLGMLCNALVHDPVKVYELEYRGDLALVQTAPVRLAALQGILAATRSERVTPVNAPLLARELGLKYRELTSEDAESYAGMLVLRALTADGPREFVGALVHGAPHVVVADGFWVTFQPTGPMLFTYHRDRPGMIGQVGTLLGQADVNIASMDVGRLAPREQAMMVLRLDDPCPPAVVERLKQEADIEAAYTIVL
jgi:D-3-phosphoglycerate dehydrogenase